MTQDMSFSLVGPYSLLRKKKKSLLLTSLLADISPTKSLVRATPQHLQVLQWFSIPAIRKLFPANDS